LSNKKNCVEYNTSAEVKKDGNRMYYFLLIVGLFIFPVSNNAQNGRRVFEKNYWEIDWIFLLKLVIIHQSQVQHGFGRY